MKRMKFAAACLSLLGLSLSVRAGELGDLLRETLAHPQVLAARVQVDAAQAQHDAATGRYLGSAALSAGWHRYEGSRVVGVYVPGSPGVPLVSERILQSGVNYTLPIDLSGAIAANRERARQDAAVAELSSRQQTLLKLHQAASAYVSLRALQKQQAVLAAYRQRVEATHARVLQEVALGRSAGVDARYAGSELARLEADEAVLRGNLAQAQADLLEASGRAQFLPVAGGMTVPAWEESAPQDTLLVRIAEAREAVSRAQADEGQRSLLPAVSLDANYFRHRGAGDERDTWTVGGVVSLPLGVTQVRQIEALKLNAAAAAEHSRAALRDAGRQLAALRAAYDAALADSRALAAEIAYREEVAGVQSEMQRLGSQTLENFFRHQRDLLDAHFRQAQAQARAVVSWSAAQVVAGLPAATYIARMDVP